MMGNYEQTAKNASKTLTIRTIRLIEAHKEFQDF